MREEPKTELERYWKERLSKAKLNLEAARAQVGSLERDALPPGPCGPDGGYAYRSAIQNDTAALIEYSRVLRIYTDLVVHGKLPGTDEQ